MSDLPELSCLSKSCRGREPPQHAMVLASIHEHRLEAGNKDEGQREVKKIDVSVLHRQEYECEEMSSFSMTISMLNCVLRQEEVLVHMVLKSTFPARLCWSPGCELRRGVKNLDR